MQTTGSRTILGMRPLAMRLLLVAFLATITFGALALFVNTTTEAGTIVNFTVNSSSDDADAIPGDGICDTVVGEPRICGLRAVIEESNALNGTNSVDFTASNTVLGSDLPDITERIYIDASTNAPGFNIDAAGATDDGLVLGLGSSGSIIRGIDIQDAPDNALLICGGAFHTIGGDPNEGIAPNGQGNTFRGSGGNGIEISGALDQGDCDLAIGSLGGHMIWGNNIGTTPLGTAADPNSGDGIYIEGGSGPDIWIGGGDRMPNGKDPAGDPPPGWGNLISGNNSDGVDFDGGTADVVIWGNWIGLGVLGNATDEFGNEGDAVYAENDDADLLVQNNVMAGGGVGPDDNFHVSGVRGDADGGLLVLGNCIGFDHTCLSSSGGFDDPAIDIEAGPANIGDGTEAGRNVIGNGGDELIDIDTSGTFVLNGNYIGFGKDGEHNAGVLNNHPDECIQVEFGDDHVIINNLIGNCSGVGIELQSTTDGNLVQNNDLGRGTDPSSPEPIDEWCIQVNGSSNEILDNIMENCGAGSVDFDADASIEIGSGSFNTIMGNDITSPIGEDAIDIEGSGIGNLVASQRFVMVLPGDGDLPIDIDDDGTTVNDAGDVDGGTNLYHNYPTFPPVSATDGCARGSAGPFDQVRIYSKVIDGNNVIYNKIGEGAANIAGDFTICDLDDNTEKIQVVGTATTTVASTTDVGCALNCTSEFSVTEQSVGAGAPATPVATDTPDAPVDTDTPVPPAETDTPVPPTATPVPPKLCGDVNLDEAVNSVDASLVLQLKAGMISSLANESSADVNNSGDVTSVDAALILQFTAGLIDEAALTCPA